MSYENDIDEILGSAKIEQPEYPEVQKQKVSQEVVEAWFAPEWDDVRTMLSSMGISQDLQISHFGASGKNVARALIETEILKTQELKHKFKEIEFDARTKYNYKMLEHEKKRNDRLEEIRYRRIIESGKLDNVIEQQFNIAAQPRTIEYDVDTLIKENAMLKIKASRVKEQ